MDQYNYPYNTSWFDLPLEMREHVITNMDFRTRCQFSDCSTTCELEALNDRLLMIFSIELHACDDNVLEIKITQNYDNVETFPTFKFEKLDEHRTLVKYLENDCDETFTSTIANGSPIEVRAEYANYYFAKFKDSFGHCYVDDNREISTLTGIKFSIINDLSHFICHFQTKNWEYFIDNGIFDLEQMRDIDYLELSGSMRFCFDFAREYEGWSANFDCVDFDQKVLDDFLYHLKTNGMNETTSIKVSFLTRRILTIDVQKLAPITTWDEQHHLYRNMCKNVVIVTECGDQKIHISYNDRFIQMKVKRESIHG